MLDASCTFPWLFEDEATPEADAMLERISAEGAAVPALWFIEVANGLGMAEPRGRLSAVDVENAMRLLGALPLTVSISPTLAPLTPVLALMRAHRLTAYDATYLRLAQEFGPPLATGDRDLQKAALAVGVPMFRPAA